MVWTMTRTTLSLTLAAALLAAACSQTSAKADAKAPDAAAKAAPAAATAAAGDPTAVPDTRDYEDQAVWHFWQTEEGTHLNHAIPDSDDAGSGFHCQTGTGQIQIAHWADHAMPGDGPETPRTETTPLTLTSGKVSKTYQASANSEEMYGGTETYADTTPDDPVLKEFARTGVLQFTAYGDTTTYEPAKPADVARLLAGCRKGSN